MAKQGSYTQWALEPYGIGMKLRSLRNQKMMTAETGLWTALLSEIETERKVPTLPSWPTGFCCCSQRLGAWPVR